MISRTSWNPSLPRHLIAQLSKKGCQLWHGRAMGKPSLTHSYCRSRCPPGLGGTFLLGREKATEPGPLNSPEKLSLTIPDADRAPPSGTLSSGSQNVRGSHVTNLLKKKKVLPWQPLHSTRSLPRHTKIGKIFLRNTLKEHTRSDCALAPPICTLLGAGSPSKNPVVSLPFSLYLNLWLC